MTYDSEHNAYDYTADQGSDLATPSAHMQLLLNGGDIGSNSIRIHAAILTELADLTNELRSSVVKPAEHTVDYHYLPTPGIIKSLPESITDEAKSYELKSANVRLTTSEDDASLSVSIELSFNTGSFYVSRYAEYDADNDKSPDAFLETNKVVEQTPRSVARLSFKDVNQLLWVIATGSSPLDVTNLNSKDIISSATLSDLKSFLDMGYVAKQEYFIYELGGNRTISWSEENGQIASCKITHETGDPNRAIEVKLNLETGLQIAFTSHDKVPVRDSMSLPAAALVLAETALLDTERPLVPDEGTLLLFHEVIYASRRKLEGLKDGEDVDVSPYAVVPMSEYELMNHVQVAQPEIQLTRHPSDGFELNPLDGDDE